MTNVETPDYSAQNARDATLVERIKQGDEAAFNELLGHYQRLVSGFAWRFIGEISKHDATITTDDLLQISTLELLRAAHAYDPTRGVGFLTFARRWIGTGMYNLARKAGAVWEARNKDPDDIPKRSRWMIELDRPVKRGGTLSLGDVMSTGAVHGVEREVLTRVYLQQLLSATHLSDAQKRIVDTYLTGEYPSGHAAAKAAGMSPAMFHFTMEKFRAAARKLHRYDEAMP